MFNKDMLYDRTQFCFVPLPTSLAYLYIYIILRINHQRFWCVYYTYICLFIIYFPTVFEYLMEINNRTYKIFT